MADDRDADPARAGAGALGRSAEATAHLDEARTLLARHRDAGQLSDWYEEIARQLRVASRRPRPSHELTDAERRIPRLLATDLTLREIGRKLYLSLNTVKTHVHSIYRKLGVSCRSDRRQGCSKRRTRERRFTRPKSR